MTGAKDVADANQWADVAERCRLLAHPASEYFRKLVASATPVAGNVLQLFRGQRIADAEAKPPSIDRMGPPPRHITVCDGRYHRTGERVLYLASSQDGARRELAAPKGELYLIRLEVPLASIRIADFTPGVLRDGDFLTAAFARAELCDLTERGGPANYLFSQVVAELVSAHWDGMRIPGARGEPGAHYSNVVLFRRFDTWREWLDPASRPYPFP